MSKTRAHRGQPKQTRPAGGPDGTSRPPALPVKPKRQSASGGSSRPATVSGNRLRRQYQPSAATPAYSGSGMSRQQQRWRCRPDAEASARSSSVSSQRTAAKLCQRRHQWHAPASADGYWQFSTIYGVSRTRAAPVNPQRRRRAQIGRPWCAAARPMAILGAHFRKKRAGHRMRKAMPAPRDLADPWRDKPARRGPDDPTRTPLPGPQADRRA